MPPETAGILWLRSHLDGAMSLAEVSARLRDLADKVDTLEVTGHQLMGPVTEGMAVFSPTRTLRPALRMLPGEGAQRPTGS